MKKFVSLLLALVMATIMIVCLPATAAAGFEYDLPGDDELASILGDYSERAYASARFKDGVIALLFGDEIAYIVDGQPQMMYRHKTDPEGDFFFCVQEHYPDAEYNLCACVGNDILSFRDNLAMEVELENVYTSDFGTDYMFCFNLEEGCLILWTPYTKLLVAKNDVTDVVTTGEYAFFTDAFGSHAFGASLADICKKTDAYLRRHPIPIVDLGDLDIWDIYPELYWYDENGFVDNTASFNEEYGIDFSSWGSAKHDFTFEDFPIYTRASVRTITETFDVPLDIYDNPLVYYDITFYGFEGYLQFYRASDLDLEKIYWYDNEGSGELTLELCNILEDAGGKVLRTDVLEMYGLEYVYDLGGQIIHVGYTDEYGPTTYVYAYNPERVDE